MKKITLAVLCLSLLGISSARAFDAYGGAFGQLGTARTLGMGQGSFMGGVGIADATSVFGAFTYGASEDVDFRIRAGLRDDDFRDTEFIFGADFKFQLWRVSVDAQNRNQSKNPFDLSLGAMFEYVSNIWQIGGHAVGSYPFAMKNGMTLSPYGRFNVRLENYTYGPYDDSEIKFGLNAGVALKMTSSVTAFGEFQLDGNDGLFLGLDFLVL